MIWYDSHQPKHVWDGLKSPDAEVQFVLLIPLAPRFARVCWWSSEVGCLKLLMFAVSRMILTFKTVIFHVFIYLYVGWLRPFAIRKPFGVFLSTIRQPWETNGFAPSDPSASAELSRVPQVRNQLARDDRNDSSSRALQDFWSGQRKLDRSKVWSLEVLKTKFEHILGMSWGDEMSLL